MKAFYIFGIMLMLFLVPQVASAESNCNCGSMDYFATSQASHDISPLAVDDYCDVNVPFGKNYYVKNFDPQYNLEPLFCDLNEVYNPDAQGYRANNWDPEYTLEPIFKGLSELADSTDSGYVVDDFDIEYSLEQVY